MKTRTEIELVDEALSSLPAAQASEHFTERVLEALEERRNRRRAPVTWVPAVAASVILAALFVAGLTNGLGRTGTDQKEHTQQLRAEHRLLREELTELNRLLQTDSSVVYLGGDEQVDLVLDLGSFAQPVPLVAGPTGTAQFASETNND